jgi:hypothetical protein
MRALALEAATVIRHSNKAHNFNGEHKDSRKAYRVGVVALFLGSQCCRRVHRYQMQQVFINSLP